MLGVRDARVAFDATEPVATLTRSAVLGETAPHTLLEIRQLVRKANPLKLTLYSVIHAQYEQMFAWFRTLPQADLAKVAFIGQSYGGMTAVRVPPAIDWFDGGHETDLGPALDFFDRFLPRQ